MRNHFLRAATDTGGGAPPSSNAWDIEFAEFTATPQNWFEVNNEEPSPLGLFFKPDGTVMYIIGPNNDSVYQYSLSTAWDVSTASYSSKSFSVNSQDLLPAGLFFKPDGTKMYIMGRGSDTVYQYDLSTAWDVSTASYSTWAFSVTTQEAEPQGLFFKDDGTEMYVVGFSADAVHQYSLSTAWDLDTASFSQSFSVASQEITPRGVAFGNSGTKMYVSGTAGNDVNEYTLSTAWDISTASYRTNFSVKSQAPSVGAVQFKSDGSVLYVVDSTSDAVWQYSLSTAWDLSTASFTNPSTDLKYVGSQEFLPTGLAFKSDGTKMYIIGYSGDDVNEYSLSTAWQISTASYVQNFSVSARDTTPYGLFFKPDGTKMYHCGSQNDSVYEYNLSTAWDVSTASYVQAFYVGTYETDPNGIYIGDSGTKMYVIGTNGDDVNEFDLSTAWDISTASHVQTFYVGGSPRSLTFKDDGTRMYVADNATNDIEQYNLTTAWDVSTASFDVRFSVSLLARNPRGVYFKPDGLRFFVLSNSTTIVSAYDIS